MLSHTRRTFKKISLKLPKLKCFICVLLGLVAILLFSIYFKDILQKRYNIEVDYYNNFKIKHVKIMKICDKFVPDFQIRSLKCVSKKIIFRTSMVKF